MPHLIEVEQELLVAAERIMEAEASGEPVSESALELFRERTVFAAEKRESVAIFLGFLEERAAALKERERALAASRKAIEAFRERLVGYLTVVLEGKGIEVACGATQKFVLAQVESVEVANVDALPDELCRIKVVREPDKVSVRRAIEKGEPVPFAAGAHIMKHTTLRVRPLAVKDRPGETLIKGRVEK